MKHHAVSPLQPGLLTDLLFATGHYVATGDHAGEGNVLESEFGEGAPRYLVVLPVNQSDLIDQVNFSKFQARIGEIIAANTVTGLVWHNNGVYKGFEEHLLEIPKGEVSTLTLALLESPGTSGWGSPQRAISTSPYYATARENLIKKLSEK